jgi:amidophosphoribosyltransferase
MLEERLKEKCAIFGIFSHPDAGNLTSLALHAMQHRGQESSGIISIEENEIKEEIIEMGLVEDIFTDKKIKTLKGDMAIGHNRYSTSGESNLQDSQPLRINDNGTLVIAHNGTLYNYEKLKKKLEEEGFLFETTADTEVIPYLINKSNKNSLVERIIEALSEVEGAYSLVLTNKNKLIGVRDPNGFRPLVLGEIEGSFVLASETTALDLINANFVRNIRPGEIVSISKKDPEKSNEMILETLQFADPNPSCCVFEQLYFGWPNSLIISDKDEIIPNAQRRREFGRQLARETREKNLEFDLVIPVPESGTHAAEGFAGELNIPLYRSLIKNKQTRTFIEPTDEIRLFGTRLKYSVVKQDIEGKRVAIVDDTIVRGNTSKKIIELIRGANASESHLCIPSPPITSRCYFGIDIKTEEELIAGIMYEEMLKESHKKTLSLRSPRNIKRLQDKIAKFNGADSVTYLSIEGLYKVAGENICVGCFTREYPIKVD